MNPFPRFSRSHLIGVALGPDRITAAPWDHRKPSRRDRELWSRLLTPVAGRATGWLDLVDALRELREAAGPAPGELNVALLPPMVQIRRIELPLLREDELRTVLTRDAGRYILHAGTAQIVGTLAPRDRRRSPVTYVVAFADAPRVDSIYAAAEAAGWGMGRVIAACSAWEVGVRLQVAGLNDGQGYLMVGGASHLEVLRFQSGRLDLCRRFPQGSMPGQVIEQLMEHASPAWFIVAGPLTRTQEFRDELQARGLPLLESTDATVWEGPPEALAASWASAAAGLELVPDRVWIERQRRTRRLSHRLLACSAALLLLSAGLELWGTQRELDAVRHQRSAIRGTVAQAMELRGTMEGIEARLTALAAAETGASRWSGIIAEVAEHLPADAHLIGMRGTGDSLLLDGVAARSAGVFESLQLAPGVAGVRAEAPIRQEGQDSGAPVERFSLGARLATTRLTSTGGR